MKSIKIAGREIGNGLKPFIIAEAGINHNGDVNIAKRMIKSASDCGADAIKFQSHFANREMIDTGATADYVGESVFNLIKRMELSREDHIELMEYAKECGIMFLSTPFSKEAVDMLDELGVPAFKIGSGELTNWPLVEHIVKKGRPIILSTGMSTKDEITDTVKFIRRIQVIPLVLMQCTSTYPTDYSDVNLKVIQELTNEFEIPVGLSDHSVGIWTALGAVALGACVIEKHFTLSREMTGPDHKASIEPHELKDLVTGSRAIWHAMGDSKMVLKEELQVQQFARESIVSMVDIKKGEKIDSDMVWVKRPGTGIPARYLKFVVGRSAKEDIPKNTVIQREQLEQT